MGQSGVSDQRYRTIVVDPPWAYPQGFMNPGTNHTIQGRKRTADERGPAERKALPYEAMPLEGIKAIPVSSLAQDDARLFLWTTSRYLPDAFEVIASWGFSYRQAIVWDKRPNVNPLAGGVAAIAAEFLLVGTRGAPGMLGRWPASVVTARKPRTVHSTKPDVFLDLVEHVSPGPYAELFSRRARLGWDYPIGDQALGGVAA